MPTSLYFCCIVCASTIALSTGCSKKTKGVVQEGPGASAQDQKEGTLPRRVEHSIELIANGGFETGDFTGWNASVQAGGAGAFFVGDNTVPLGGGLFATPFVQASVGPRSGNFYAVSDETGASAQAVESGVTTPLEQAINGVQGMTCMQSQSTNSGMSQITVFFEVGRDPDLAGIARPFLKAAAISAEDAVTLGSIVRDQLRTAMFAIGAANLHHLRSTPHLVKES